MQFRLCMMLATPRGHKEASLVGMWHKVVLTHYAFQRAIKPVRNHPTGAGAGMAERALEQAMIEGLQWVH